MSRRLTEKEKRDRLRARGKDLEYNAKQYNTLRKRAKLYEERYLNSKGFRLPDDYYGDEKTAVTLRELNSARAHFSASLMKREATYVISDWKKTTYIKGEGEEIRSGAVEYQQEVNVPTPVTMKSNPVDYINELKENVEKKHTITTDVSGAYYKLLAAMLGKPEVRPGDHNRNVSIPSNGPYDPDDPYNRDYIEWVWKNAKIHNVNLTNDDVLNKFKDFTEHPYTSDDLYNVYSEHRTKNNDAWDAHAQAMGYDQSVMNRIERILNTSYAWQTARKESFYEGGTGGAIDEEWRKLGDQLYRAAEMSMHATKPGEETIVDRIIREVEMGEKTLSEITEIIDQYVEMRDAFNSDQPITKRTDLFA